MVQRPPGYGLPVVVFKQIEASKPSVHRLRASGPGVAFVLDDFVRLGSGQDDIVDEGCRSVRKELIQHFFGELLQEFFLRASLGVDDTDVQE